MNHLTREAMHHPGFNGPDINGLPDNPYRINRV